MIISKNIDTVEKYGSSVTIVHCNETIIYRKIDTEDEYNALNREFCAIARAPQCYKIDEVLPASENAEKNKMQFVDTFSLMQNSGVTAKSVECDPSNIKITTHIDFVIAKALLK